MIQRAIAYLFEVVVVGTVLYVAFLAGTYLVYTATPVSSYFEYSSVHPVSEPVLIGEEYILMESELVIKRPGNMYWNDVLRCYDGRNHLSYYSQYDTSAKMVYSDDNPRTPIRSQWRYRGDLPDVPATCVMVSTITRKLPMAVEKTQVIVSRPFSFDYPQSSPQVP